MEIDPKHIKKKKITGIEDPFEFGVYTWKMPDGKVLGHEGNMLNVPSQRGDIRKMASLREYVNKELGILLGEPMFLPGVTRLTEDEHDDQMQQMMEGYVPSMDLGSTRDDLIRAKKEGRL
jgi:hypothetical protein